MQIEKGDIIKILTLIRLNFENAYKCNSKDDNILLIESWYDILKDYPREIVFEAVKKSLRVAEFAPRIGTIVKEIEKMQSVFEKDDMELWGELQGVLREVSRCTYRFNHTYIEEDGISQGEKARRRVTEIYNNLDPALKDYCRDERGLIELARYTDEQNSYERGRFMRIMPTIRDRQKEKQLMPDNIKMLLEGITQKMTLKIEQRGD